MGMQVANRWGSGIVAIHRGREQAPFDSSGVANLDDYVAHLRRMLAVRGRLAATGRRLDTVEAMLDHLGQGALLVRADGTLVHANAIGEALLHRGDFLTQRRGVLVASSDRSTARLREAIDAACAPGAVTASALLIDRLAGRPATASVIPLRAGNGGRHALVIVEIESRLDEAAPKLQALYGLTPAEAAIGIHIAKGTSPRSISDLRGVSVETVRSQIKSLSAKLGCVRQSEIVAVISALPTTRPIRDEAANEVTRVGNGTIIYP